VLHVAGWKYTTQKIAILSPSHIFVGLYRQSEKNLLNSNTSSTYHDNMVNVGLGSVGEFGASLQISAGFASWQRYCTAL